MRHLAVLYYWEGVEDKKSLKVDNQKSLAQRNEALKQEADYLFIKTCLFKKNLINDGNIWADANSLENRERTLCLTCWENRTFCESILIYRAGLLYY
jgi:hypothetical protein